MRLIITAALLTALSLLAACEAPEVDEDDGDLFAGEEDDACDPTSDQPCISHLEAWCREQDDGAYVWEIMIDAAAEVVDAEVTVLLGATTVHEPYVYCDYHQCTGRWDGRMTDPMMSCSPELADDFTFLAVVIDEGGEVSEEAEAAGFYRE